MTDATVPVPIDSVLECEVLVIGSGVSGYCAAIQAGREGHDVILLEKDDVLGGNSGPNLGVGITGADRHNTFATESGVIQELQEEAAWVNGFTKVLPRALPYNISRRNEAVVQSALEAAGVRILKRHFAMMPRMEGDRIAGVVVQDLAAFRTIEVRISGVVIEASGDGHIGALAGADFDFGSEAASEYGERSAPAERRSWVQGTSLVAIAQKTPGPVEFIPPPGTKEYTPRLWHGKISSHIRHHEGSYRDDIGVKFLYMTEAGGDQDTIRDDAAIYEELLGQLWAEWNHVKNGPHKEEAADWDLLWVSPKAGKRESRRFMGDVVLTQTDLEAGRRFADDIAYGGHDLDDHQSLGAAGSNIFGHSIPPMYGIPFRACYSRNVPNLLLAGRLVSATHLAHSSIRVMRTGAAIGQAVGLAAAMCCELRASPRELYEGHVDELQRRLIRRDGTILCRQADDPADLAPAAKILASSEVLFNDQTPGHMVPMVTEAGNLFWDWPERIEAADVCVRNDSGHDRGMTLKVLRSRNDPGWTTGEIWGKIQWNDLRDSAFEVLAEQTFVLPAGFSGWHTVRLDAPLALKPKDAARDADRLIITLSQAEGVWWALNEQQHEICALVEHSHHDTRRNVVVGEMGTMRLTPPVSLGEAVNVTNGHNRRFSRGPTNVWISRDACPQEITLEWPEAVTFDCVEVTFDNLVERRHDNPWEAAERVHPMLAKEYELYAWKDGAWIPLAGDTCNVHRFRSHRMGAVTTDKVKLTVLATHGEGRAARVYRIAVFSESTGA